MRNSDRIRVGNFNVKSFLLLLFKIFNLYLCYKIFNEKVHTFLYPNVIFCYISRFLVFRFSSYFSHSSFISKKVRKYFFWACDQDNYIFISNFKYHNTQSSYIVRIQDHKSNIFLFYNYCF